MEHWYWLIFAAAALWFFFEFFGKRGGEQPAAPEDTVSISLIQDEQGEYISLDGDLYFAYEGAVAEDAAVPVWDWHGRMGDGIGYLFRDEDRFPCGELYRLRGETEGVLLAFLPQDGWPVTDMKLFLREDFELPEVVPEEFCFGEIYRSEGEFPEETLEKIREFSDGDFAEDLATAWLSAEPSVLPEGVEFDRYRIRLYSVSEPGLYVLLTLYVNLEQGVFVLEGFRFRGDILLPSEFGARLLNSD